MKLRIFREKCLVTRDESTVKLDRTFDGVGARCFNRIPVIFWPTVIRQRSAT